PGGRQARGGAAHGNNVGELDAIEAIERSRALGPQDRCQVIRARELPAPTQSRDLALDNGLVDAAAVAEGHHAAARGAEVAEVGVPCRIAQSEAHERVARRLAHRRAMAELSAHSLELVVEVWREVFAAIAQRGQRERPERQPCEEVVAKPPGAD